MRRAILIVLTMAVALVVGGGVAVAVVKFGTDSRDFLVGTDDEDVLYGRGGNDSLTGRGEGDVLYGEDGDDVVYGGYVRFDEMFRENRPVPDGEDKLFGGRGEDCVFGGTQDDILYGGAGDDVIGLLCFDFVADTGSDLMYGGDGDDGIIAIEPDSRKQQPDTVYCGPGRDTVIYKKGVDRVFDCERKNPREGLR